MSLFSKQKAGLLDVIRCNELDYLIWMWHTAGTEPGKRKILYDGEHLCDNYGYGLRNGYL